MQIRAYSTLELKDVSSAASGKRLFTGIASTPSVDHDGDIVEPKGASFTLPIPFLWQHDRKDPIGWITSADVQDHGILVKGEVAKIEGDSALAQRLSSAWDYISAGLVKGLSVGFKVKERQGNRIRKWGWFELSAVTMPANGECSILALKSADEAMRRALLSDEVHSVVRLADRDFPAVAGPRRLPGVTYL
jgi:HK97 family phage prohead protease